MAESYVLNVYPPSGKRAEWKSVIKGLKDGRLRQLVAYGDTSKEATDKAMRGWFDDPDGEQVQMAFNFPE